jgi:hypothetical protein
LLDPHFESSEAIVPIVERAVIHGFFQASPGGKETPELALW